MKRSTAFWILAVTIALFLFASSAPSPLYVVFQDEWGFSTLTLTAVFGVYALALLGSLLIGGGVSDLVGRRSTILVALGLELVAMFAFAEAQGVGWLFAARIVQGIATGIAMGAISAALLDLQPPGTTRGALVGVAAPLSGLAAGALIAGLLVEYAPDPTALVFWLLLGGFAALAAAVTAIPESVPNRVSLSARALRPRLAVPAAIRPAFVASIPALVATWSLGGLVLSLGPSLTAGVLGESSHLAGGFVIFVLAGVSAVASVALREVDAQRTARGGLVALIAGVAIVLAGLGVASMVLFVAGAAIAGLGFGPAFGGAFRALTSGAHIDRRAGLVSAILSIAYLAFSLPALAAGLAVTEFGLQETATVYGLALIALTGIALALTGRLENLEADAAAEPALAAPE